MVSLILLLAAVTGLGLRLARWVECLPDRSLEPVRGGGEQPAKADKTGRLPAAMFGSVL
jgi:hypothetical protein